MERSTKSSMMKMDSRKKFRTLDNRPLMTVFAGTNGAGKSTITSVLLQHLYLGEVIDADAIAKEINPGSPGKANWTAGREVLQRVEKCIHAERDFSIETTLAGGNALRQMRTAKNHGFEILLAYTSLPKPLDDHPGDRVPDLFFSNETRALSPSHSLERARKGLRLVSLLHESPHRRAIERVYQRFHRRLPQT